MAVTPKALTLEEQAWVDLFLSGKSSHEVAKQARVSMLTVERVMRRAMGVAGGGSRRASED
jgi:transposase